MSQILVAQAGVPVGAARELAVQTWEGSAAPRSMPLAAIRVEPAEAKTLATAVPALMLPAWGMISAAAPEVAGLSPEGLAQVGTVAMRVALLEPAALVAAALVAAALVAAALVAAVQSVRRRRRASIPLARRTAWIAPLGPLRFQSAAFGSVVRPGSG